MAVKYGDGFWCVRVKDGPRRKAKSDSLSRLCGDGRYGFRVKTPSQTHHWQPVRRAKNTCQLISGADIKRSEVDLVALKIEWDAAGKRHRKAMRVKYGFSRFGPPVSFSRQDKTVVSTTPDNLNRVRIEG